MVMKEFFAYAQGFMANVACTSTSPANNYTEDDLLSIYTLMTKSVSQNPIYHKVTRPNKLFKYLYMHLRLRCQFQTSIHKT